MQQVDQSQYDFIMSGGNKPRSSLLPSDPNGRKRLLVVGIAAVGLLLIFGLIFGLLLSRPDPAATQSLKLAQQHTELMRITDIGVDKAKTADTRNLAATLKLTLQSTDAKIIDIASNANKKLSPAQLAGGKNSKTDSDLTEAEQNNRFDEAFNEIIYAELDAYLKQLRVVHDMSRSKANKATLDDIYTRLSQLSPSSEED